MGNTTWASPKMGYPLAFGFNVIEFLRDGSFDELLSFIEHDLGEEWKHSALNDCETRERIYQDLQALKRINEKLRAVVDSTKLDS